MMDIKGAVGWVYMTGQEMVPHHDSMITEDLHTQSRPYARALSLPPPPFLSLCSWPVTSRRVGLRNLGCVAVYFCIARVLWVMVHVRRRSAEERQSEKPMRLGT